MSKSMEKANYNHDAGNSGWIYDFLYDFELENESIMTYGLLNQIKTDIPPFEIYEAKNITPKIIKDREKVVNMTDNNLLTLEQTNTRSK